MRNLFSNKIIFSIFIIALLFFGVSFYKATHTSFTHDESFSYNFFAQEKFMDMVSFKHAQANNHLLNTSLMMLCEHTLGNSELSLRLPNLLAHLGYLIFSFLLIRKLNNWMMIPLYLILNANPYFNDFFSLARGYGLSICFMTGSIYYFLKFIETNKSKYYTFCLSATGLSILSNFTLIYFFAALVFIYNLVPVVKKKLNHESLNFNFSKFISYNLPNIISAVVLTVILYEPIRRLMNGQLWFGGDIGFFHDTVNTLIASLLYGAGYGEMAFIIIKVFMIAIVTITIALLFCFLVKHEPQNIFRSHPLFVVCLFLILIPFITFINRQLTGTKFNIERTALFYYPLITLNICFLFQFMFEKFKTKIFTRSSAVLISALFLFHFLNTVNFNFYPDWKYDMNTKNMLSVLEQEVKQDKSNRPVSLGITWFFEPTVNYYRKSHHLDWLMEVTRKGVQGNYDYFYVLQSDLDSLAGFKTKLINFYPSSNSYFLKNKTEEVTKEHTR